MRERLGHVTKAQKASVSVVKRRGKVEAPSLPSATHEIARRWYDSLKESGQAEYFEPSDWAAALYVAEMLTRTLEAPKFSAPMFGLVWNAMEGLLTTEASRRRVRIEIERVIEDAGNVSEFEAYKKAIGL